MKLDRMKRVTLPNGLRLLMLPDDRGRSVSVSVWIGSGSRFELPERSGASHYIEHMLFKGTERRSARDIAEQMDGIGGQLNAYTTKEYTCVYARALDSHLPIAFDIIADMITSSKLSDEDMETERGVILEEIGMYEDSPEDLMLDGMYDAMWGGDMLGANIAGTRETVSRMTVADLRAHMADQYTAPRIVCAISGAFDCDSVVEMVTKGFGGLPGGGLPFEAVHAGYRSKVNLLEKDFEQNHICLGFPAVSQEDDRRHALGLLNSICGGSSSSRLFQRIREELGLAYSVGCSFVPYMREGMFEVDAAVNPRNEEAAIRELVAVLCRLRQNGVTEEEFLRTKEQHKATVIMGLEGNAAVAAHMGRGELLRGRIKSEDEILATLDSITLEQVNQAAKDFIRFDNFSLCAVGKVRNEDGYLSIVQSSIF